MSNLKARCSSHIHPQKQYKKSIDYVYPCLLENHYYVVFFERKNCGMIVYVKNSGMLTRGTYSKEWDMGAFKPFEGDITLRGHIEND